MRTRRITDPEREKLRKRLNKSDQLITDIAYQTGLRISDILQLPSDLSSTRISVREQKTGKTRVVHIKASTLRQCKAYAAKHKNTEGVLFDCDRTTVYRHIRQAAKGLGLENISAHSYRKAYAHAYYMRYGLKATQKEMQHNNIATTCIYVFDWRE